MTMKDLLPPQKWSPIKIASRINNSTQVDTLQEKVLIFTDGSRVENKDEPSTVGCAFVAKRDHSTYLTYKAKLPTYATVYQAELSAIKAAVDHCLAIEEENIAILSDSMSALQAIGRIIPENKIAAEIRRKLDEALERGKNISLHHVKAHINIAGNEEADRAANDARHCDNNLELPIPRCKIKRDIRNETRKEINKYYVENEWGRTIKLFVPTYDDPMRHKLLIDAYTTPIYTGHLQTLDYLAWRKHAADNICPCGKVQDVRHILTTCKYFIEQNVRVANEMNLPLPYLLGNWDHLRTHRNLHKYIRRRAKALTAQITKMNEYVSEAKTLHLSVESAHTSTQNERQLLADRLKLVNNEMIIEGDLTGIYNWKETRPRKRPNSELTTWGEAPPTKRFLINKTPNDTDRIAAAELLASTHLPPQIHRVTHGTPQFFTHLEELESFLVRTKLKARKTTPIEANTRPYNIKLRPARLRVRK